MGNKKLLSTQTLVQAPFVTVSMGGNILGTYTNNLKEKTDKFMAPNYITSMTVKKINGAINQYTINICYVIYPGADPNLIEKMLSSVQKDRKITISYGDCNQQGDAFKNEEALITKVTFNTNFKSPQISYTISAVSTAVYTKGVVRDWVGIKNKKPSEMIRSILENESFGLKDVFGAMLKNQLIDRYNLIPDDDKEVDLMDKPSTNTFDYLKYLVSCMQSDNDENPQFYTLSVFDTDDAPFYGPYFKITRVNKNPSINIIQGSYDLDIGYPGDNFVSNYSITSNEQWSILYEYGQKKGSSQKSYSIDDTGKVISKNSPIITRNQITYDTLPEDENWWKMMTEFPIKAQVEIKGLVRPVNLVEYIHINVIFFGRKSIYSGYYIITEQNDTIGPQGYTTTMQLTRIKGDEE